MAEYTREELLRMQQNAVRRVNEMNERARRSLERTPPSMRGRQAAPQFERAHAPNEETGGAQPQSGQGGGAPRSNGPGGPNAPRPSGGGHHPAQGQYRPTGTAAQPAAGSHPSRPSPGTPAPHPGASSGPSPSAQPSGIARFLNLRQIFKDADTPLILAVLLLLYTENDDPMLMMALVYIML